MFFSFKFFLRFFSSSFRAKAIALSPKMHWISNIVVGLYFLSVVTKFGIRKVYMGYLEILALQFTSNVVILKIIMFMICYHIGYRTQFHEASIHLFSSPILLISPDLHLIKQPLYGSSSPLAVQICQNTRQIDQVNPTDTDFQNCSFRLDFQTRGDILLFLCHYFALSVTFFRCILKHPTNMATPFNTTVVERSQDGDIININVTVYLDVTEQCLERGISVCKDVSILMTRVRCYYNRFRHMGNNRYCSMPNLQLRIRAYGSKKADN
uniref:Uncharacterized protein n=1 Tax=Lactuca sativa TaxID=4236 RepID=A0A9R1VNP8_LACSA|nr:hypothetical protein LSAT_V11C400208560 [Lactuca sativa]